MAAFPTIVFGVFTVVFTLQQNQYQQAAHEQDQRQADEINRRVIFKEYIDDMKELLGKGFHEHINQSLLHIRVQTLTVLRQLDIQRKRDVILFLYENGLIRHDKQPILHLDGADLSGIRFEKSSMTICNLSHLFLPSIYAENMIFYGCFLYSAVFNNALMSSTKFYSCNMAYSSFVETNLTDAQFHDVQLFGTDMIGAALIRTSIIGGIFQNVNLTNTDLYHSNINDQLLYPITIGGIAPNTFLNTRFPNGSFSNIQTDNLVVPSRCSHNITPPWSDLLNKTSVTTINADELISTATNVTNSDCFFMLKPKMTAWHTARIITFSLLINLQQAKLNFSFLVGLRNANVNGEMTVQIHFLQEEGSFDYAHSIRS
ncbi:unnamed protein product [Adineta ricciae]|uniref:Pentapeptide repeat-containing protein n=1 Tax=Adineta ricciae TaxID=249248 RepID=A0A814CU54_ADIRI|nr:unnamed protein product [Adineta ricciae]